MPFYDNPSFSADYNGREGKRLFDEADDFLTERAPCPICGHPTGDCAGENQGEVRIAGLGVTESLKEKQMILLEQDIYEDRQITPFLSVKVLIHKKGKSISYKEAERLGLV